MAPNNQGLRPGTVIHGRYRIERVLGSGGFGITYRVTDLQTGDRAAMKEYFPRDIASRRFGSREVQPTAGNEKLYDRFRTQFLEEAKTIYRFRGHPNIVDVRHLFLEENTAYYVMEYIDGQDLNRYLEQRGGSIPWQTLRPILSPVAQALEFLHGENTIHCDISPDNIFLTEDAQVKLIDFGAAKSLLKTPSSVVALKRGYAPPELAYSSGKLGPWTDVYALGVTVYRCVTGELPPAAEERIARECTRWPSELGAAIPSPAWEAVLRRSMALRWQERYPNVGLFWQELTEATGSLGLLCIGGSMAGRWYSVTGELLVGTDTARCQILLPPGCPGVSRVHLRIWEEGDTLMAMDLNSTYGTWLDGERMLPGLACTLGVGRELHLGAEECFRVCRN